MRRRTIGLQLACLAFASLSHQAFAGALVTHSSETHSTSPAGVLVATDWSAGSPGVTNPLDFNRFNPALGTLTSIDVTLTVTIRNDYMLIFPKTPVMTTIDVATSQTSDPSILSNPVKRALLTDGPDITPFAPDGHTRLFGLLSTRQPVDFVQLTESSGKFSSLLPPNDPNFIPPTMTEQVFSRTLTPGDSPFAEFIGTGKVDLPVTATAFSSFFSSGGNGGGAVFTTARASVEITFNYSAVPEPASAILLGLGIGITLLARKMRGRAHAGS